MNNNKYILMGLIAATSLFQSCDDEEYVAPEFSAKNFGVYSSLYADLGTGQPNYNPTYVSINSLLAFDDISNGYVSHEWSFWRDSNNGEGEPNWERVTKDNGVQFIKKNSQLGYGSKKDYSAYYDNSIDPASTSIDNIQFLYNKCGYYKVKIKNYYDSPISYFLSSFNKVTQKEVVTYYESIPTEDGKYLVESDYIMEVYDTLSVKVKAFEDAECTQEVDFLSSDHYTIAAGTTLYFKDVSGTSRFDTATSRVWTWNYNLEEGETAPIPLPAVTPSSSSELVQAFSFNSPGSFKLILSIRREKDPAAVNLPTAYQTKEMPVVFIVQ